MADAEISIMNFLQCRYLAAIGFMALAAPAQAQLGVCSPGQTPVAFDTTNPSVPVPLCPLQDTGQPAASASDTYAGMAYHPDASDVWVAGNYNGPRTAVSAALSACSRVMGDGCQSDGDWWNTKLDVLRNARGDLYFVFGSLSRRDRKAAVDACQAGRPLACEKIGTFRAHTRRHLPGAEARKVYGAAAWVKSGRPYDGKLYIASGAATLADASQRALSACEAANSAGNCDIEEYTGSGVLQPFLAGEDDMVITETGSQRARLAAENICKARGAKPCVLQPPYPAVNSGDHVHVFRR